MYNTFEEADALVDASRLHGSCSHERSPHHPLGEKGLAELSDRIVAELKTVFDPRSRSTFRARPDLQDRCRQRPQRAIDMTSPRPAARGGRDAGLGRGRGAGFGCEGREGDMTSTALGPSRMSEEAKLESTCSDEQPFPCLPS